MQEELASRLAEGWQAVYEQSGQAIDWIRRTRGNAKRLDSEADHLILKLRRARNQARSLRKVSLSASTVGFFGLSQAGKSYLISALAAGEQGKLETILDGQRLDFVEHINPPGGGKEATGLVTRFTRRPHPAIAGFPLQLRLFTEIELVKILVNSFFNDFNLEKAGFAFNADLAKQAHEALNSMQSKRQTMPVAGVTEDDVVELWDYLRERYPWSVSALEGDFLPRLVELAPWLAQEDRAGLFSFLWGRIGAFTDIFNRLARRLAQLGHAQVLYAPLSSLVESAPGGSGFVQRDSIMNVDMLERLGQDNDTPVSVCVTEPAPAQQFSIPRAELAALTAELTIVLAEEPRQAIFNRVDLLDFPGYRGRLKHESLDNLATAFKDQRTNPVAQLFLRGKVAYLFERYTDLQEMNVLVVCTASHKQSDVADVGPVLTGWIKRTQGETAQARASRPSGLLWAITMFDMKIADSMSKSQTMLETVWEDLIKMTMLERFQQYSWMQEWSPGQPFDNTFLVRKPCLPVTFLNLENGRETGIAQNCQQALDLMAETFAAQPLVREHVAEPAHAWQAMMQLNDGGISRLSEYLAKVAVRDHKLARLREQLQETVHDLVEGRLGPWFHHQGADEVVARQRLAQSIVDALSRRARVLGDLQNCLLLSEEVLQSLYLRSGLDEVRTAGHGDPKQGQVEADVADDDALGLDLNLDLFGDKPQPAATGNESVSRVGSDARFARAVIREWINHLRSIPEDARVVRYFKLDRKVLEQLTDELITAVARFDLESQLLEKVTQTEQSGTRRERLADRQVLVARAVLGDFLAWLGFDTRQQTEHVPSRANPGHAIFDRPARVDSGALPPIQEQALDFTKIYLADWLVAFAHMVVGNAGHDAGREINAQQNAELGSILTALKSARVPV